MKYTRGVVYKVDQKKMTVEQVYAVGQEKGYDYYSPVTGLAEYMPDKDSFVVYYSTAGLGETLAGKKGRVDIHPFLAEYKWGEKDPAVLMSFKDTMGYQAWVFDLKKAFPGNTK
ncbi:aryl-sulfate sulfotransferase, partial [Sutterella massiliensis]